MYGDDGIGVVVVGAGVVDMCVGGIGRVGDDDGVGVVGGVGAVDDVMYGVGDGVASGGYGVIGGGDGRGVICVCGGDVIGVSVGVCDCNIGGGVVVGCVCVMCVVCDEVW